MENLQHELDLLQNKCIGLFKLNGYDSVELVISEDEGLLHTVSIGTLGGLNELHISSDRGLFVRFPNNETLFTFKSNPFALSEFYKQFK